jgi:hypothetical protein
VALKYDLQRVGPFGFQDLCAAVASRVLGAHVRPMGRGRDGGRDLLTTDPVRWSDHVVWAGRTVFQVKHKDALTSPGGDATWAWTEVRKELNAWADNPKQRSTVPDQLVFVTNVPLTPPDGSGGYDRVVANIEKWFADLDNDDAENALDGQQRIDARHARVARRDRMSAVRAWKILDGYHLEGWLDAYRDVRLAFEGFLTVGDVLADLSRFAVSLSEAELSPALKQHARWALINERNIYFDEAGADTKPFPIEAVIVDLPVHSKREEGPHHVTQYVLDRGDRVLRPSLAANAKPRHLIVAGAPGNGKTTISKFIVHAYRAAWLGEDDGLGDELRKAVAGTERALAGIGRPMPANRRWPLRIDLAKFSNAKATDADYTLLTFIAQTLSNQAASGRVTKSVLAPWLKTWPTLLMLDGLDEVTEPTVRKGLVADIEAFVAEAENDDADMLVVVTTRPTGYQDELSPAMFERLDLSNLAIDDALRYGRLVAGVRVPNDEIRRSAVIDLLEEAAADDTLQRLLRTPLQVLIMSIVAESSKRFAPSRYQLFNGYYATVEQRERDKATGLATLIRDHHQEVLDLHRRVGLLLQKRAETATGAESLLSPEDLRGTAWNVLADAGYNPSDGDRALLDRIIEAATHRLVLLTPHPDGGFGFDVRSLQELMAALALTTGTLAEALPRLRAIGASPHWRNTFLFAAGRYFAEPQPHQKDAVTELIVTLDADAPERLSRTLPVGPEVALEVIDDGMATEPKYLHQLIEHALSALSGPEPTDVSYFARMLMSTAGKSDAARGLVADGLRRALGGTWVARETAEAVQRNILELAKDEPSPDPNIIGLSQVRRDPGRALPPEPTADWDSFWETIRTLSEDSTADALEWVGATLQQLAKSGFTSPMNPDLQIYLADGDVAFVADEALGHVASASSLLVASLRSNIGPTMWRQPVSGL